MYDIIDVCINNSKALLLLRMWNEKKGNKQQLKLN